MNFLCTFIRLLSFPFFDSIIFIRKNVRIISVCWSAGFGSWSSTSEYWSCTNWRYSDHERLAAVLLSSFVVRKWSWYAKKTHQHAEVSTHFVSFLSKKKSLSMWNVIKIFLFLQRIETSNDTEIWLHSLGIIRNGIWCCSMLLANGFRRKWQPCRFGQVRHEFDQSKSAIDWSH